MTRTTTLPAACVWAADCVANSNIKILQQTGRKATSIVPGTGELADPLYSFLRFLLSYCPSYVLRSTGPTVSQNPTLRGRFK
jgi:hypothetical protein